MAKEVIFVADDFGASGEINDAILHAHLSGQLTGAALMMAQPGTDAAVQLALIHPTLQIGWHLHLNDSVPATIGHWPWGASPARAGLTITLSPKAQRLMRHEVARQWQLYQATGLECRFINSHHHIQAHPLVYRAMLHVVGPQFHGWIRSGHLCAFDNPSRLRLWTTLERLFLSRRHQTSPWRSSDTLWGFDRLFHMNAPEVRAAIARLPDGLHEFLFHPRTRTCPDTQCLLQLKQP